MSAFTIDIPQELGFQAQAAGLFNQDKIAAIFQDALRQNNRANLFATLRGNQIHADALIHPAQIRAEIQAARQSAHL
jgi:crotonobetainyl-CoA:carnitine CoA-transferase CaiB-like acyl-CoA transferase